MSRSVDPCEICVLRQDAIVVWIPDVNLLDVAFTGPERADELLKSVEEFVPEKWGLPPYDA